METKMHMYLATTEKGIISEELYKGHCSEWIDTFRGCGSRVEYDILKDYCKSHWGDFPECKFTKKENVYFGHHAITVKDYINWYHKYKPYLNLLLLHYLQQIKLTKLIDQHTFVQQL